MAAQRLSSLQRDFYRRNTTGVSATTPAGELERTYMVRYIQANEAGLNAAQKDLVQHQPFDELQIRWIKVWITTNGGTPPNNDYQSSHWAKAVEVLGKPVLKRQTQNMMTFFLNATS